MNQAKQSSSSDGLLNDNNSDFVIYEHQVSGKTPKFTDKQQKYIYKAYSQSERQFFQYLQGQSLSSCSYSLKKFMPVYYGTFTKDQLVEIDLNNQHNFIDSKNSTFKQDDLKLKKQKNDQNQSEQRMQWIHHINSRVNNQNQKSRFLKIKNLTQHFKYPNIMDIKLGIKDKIKNRQKYADSTTYTHMFRINGLSVKQFQKQMEFIPVNKSKEIDKENSLKQSEFFMSKYYCQKIQEAEMSKHLGFFCFDGCNINTCLLDRIIEKTKQLILGFKSFIGFRFMSSSIFIAFDAYDSDKLTVNFIDFDKYQPSLGIDESVQKGAQHFLRFLIQVKQNLVDIQAKLRAKQLKYFESNKLVIP